MRAAFLISLFSVMAISVEALDFIVIGRSCSEGFRFDSHYRVESFLRFNSQPIIYGAVGSFVLSWSLNRQPVLPVPLDSIV